MPSTEFLPSMLSVKIVITDGRMVPRKREHHAPTFLKKKKKKKKKKKAGDNWKIRVCDTFGRFPPFVFKGDNFCDFLFAFLHAKSLMKRVLL